MCVTLHTNLGHHCPTIKVILSPTAADSTGSIRTRDEYQFCSEFINQVKHLQLRGTVPQESDTLESFKTAVSWSNGLYNLERRRMSRACMAVCMHVLLKAQSLSHSIIVLNVTTCATINCFRHQQSYHDEEHEQCSEDHPCGPSAAD